MPHAALQFGPDDECVHTQHVSIDKIRYNKMTLSSYLLASLKYSRIVKQLLLFILEVIEMHCFISNSNSHRMIKNCEQ